MANHALLNNIDHKDLRIDTGRTAALGDDVMFALTFPAEFRNVQAQYPIVFRKTAEGAFQPVALFGFQEGSNLFLDDGRWDATYLPLAIERQPFLIGRDGEELMVHIDLDNPRVGTDSGEPLFREQGGTTEFMDRITSVLLSLHNGLERVPAFVDALLRHELLESFALDVELDDGSLNRLVGFYTINEDRLRALDGAALEQLHRDGHLEPVYMAVASVSRFRDLIERMNRRRVAGH
ncbi:SapC family protein [Pseudoxanthomonas putridarboris]|uniref:SapC family protein n=1 Tax=Pseudoxanthomonas putridarboris TaxID=752605 RepID=A0ABU9IVJ9_9GAMM